MARVELGTDNDRDFLEEAQEPSLRLMPKLVPSLYATPLSE